jgi:uncharacterized membrane protein (DUF2068 family)
MHRPHLHGPRTLALIAAFKFLKSISLVVLAIALLRLRQPEAGAHFREWLGTFPLATGHELVDRAISGLLGMSTHTMDLIAAIALGYAVLYAIEGIGLWINARWAQYLTVVSTSLFVPIELWQIAKHFTPMKLLALVINIAIVIYLLWLLRGEIAADHRAAADVGPRSKRS